MNQLTYSKSIFLIFLLFTFFFTACVNEVENDHPVFKDQHLEQINQQLIAFDSLVYQEEIDSLENYARPIVADIIRDLKQMKDPAKCYYLLAKAYRIHGACMEWDNAFDQALEDYLQAKDLLNKYGGRKKFDIREESDILNYLGVYYQNIYVDPILSNAYLLQSNELNQQLNRPIELVRNWINLGNNAMIAQKLDRAKQCFNTAEQIYQQIPPNDEYKIDYYGLLNFKGMYHKYIADSLTSVGQETLAKKNCDLAFSNFIKTQEGLAQFKESNPRLLNKQLAVYLNCLSILIRNTQYYTNPQDSIRKYIQKAIDLIPKESQAIFTKKFAWTIAYLNAIDGHEKEAVAIIEEAHQRNLQEKFYEQALINPYSLENAYNILIVRSMIYGMLAKKSQSPKDWLKAIQACKENLTYVIEVRNKLVPGASQELFSIEFLARTEMGMNYVYQFWKQKKQEQTLNLGLDLLSRIKALLLKQQLQKSRFFNLKNSNSKTNPAYQEYVLQRAMQKAAAQSDLQLFEQTKTKYSFFKDTLEKSKFSLSQRYYMERFTTSTPNIEHIRQLLPNDQAAVIDYQSSYKFSYALLITKKSAQLIPLNLDAKFYTSMADYRNRMDGNSKKIYTSAQSLYQYLIAPIDSFLQTEKIKDLIVVPDKFTTNLAFESLVFNNSVSSPGFLLEKYNICYHYSLATWSIQQQLEHQKSKAKKSFGSFVAVPRTNGAFSEACASIALPQLAKMSSDLKHTIRAGELYENATRETFLAQYPQFDMIQLILHGCEDKEKGNQPYLVFAPGNSENDRLWLQDIYELSFNSRLVVLASCLTAQGEVTSNEGSKSIARAFLFGGCPRVIAGINNIPDQSGSIILGYFYDFIKKNVPPHQALTEAKRKFVLQSKDKHPSNWAGLVFIGDPRWN